MAKTDKEEKPIYLDEGRNADWIKTLWWDLPTDVAGFHRMFPEGIDPDLPAAEPLLRASTNSEQPELKKLIVALNKAGFPVFKGGVTGAPGAPEDATA